MNKGDLINIVAEKSGVTKAQAGDAVAAVFGAIEGTLQKGESAAFIGFGTFSTTVRKAREGRNPATGATIQIPEKTMIKFKAGKALSESVNK